MISNPDNFRKVIPPIPEAFASLLSNNDGQLSFAQKFELKPENWQDLTAVGLWAEALLTFIAPFYEHANEILDQELPGINDHSLNHLEAVKALAENLLEVAENAGFAMQKPKELLTLYAAIGLHDVAQGVWGREDHAFFGSIITKALLVDAQFHDDSKVLGEKVQSYVRHHATKEYNYDLAKVEGDVPYAVMVLADECHIERGRVTESGQDLFTKGNNDKWFLLNYLCEGTAWSWNEETKLPEWILQIAQGDETLNLIGKHREALGLVGLDVDGNEINLESLCFSLLAELVLTPKINLFRSACQAIFKQPNFSVKVIGPDHTQTYSFIKNA